MVLAHGLRGIDGLLLRGLSAGQRPVVAWFLVPHPLASSIACLASGSRAHRCHSAGGTPGPCLLWGLKLEHLAAYWPPDAPAMSFLCSITARCGNQQKKRHAFMDLTRLCWRDSLSIKTLHLWCISMRAPPALIGSSNVCHHMAALIHWDEQAEFCRGPGAWHCWPEKARSFRTMHMMRCFPLIVLSAPMLLMRVF